MVKIYKGNLVDLNKLKSDAGFSNNKTDDSYYISAN